MQRIWIAEDDESIREELSALLRGNGYLPVQAPPCELALINVNLPGESGFELCRKWKEKSSAPVIFLTARDTAADELAGFAAGGDDYIKKPYNPSVLLARISRLLRPEKRLLSAGGLTLDEDAFTLYCGGNSVSLTKTEQRILHCLMQKRMCSKQMLIEELWADSCYIDENALYVNINRLREKLRSIGAEGAISTVRGVGYRL